MLEQDKQPVMSTRQPKRIWWFVFGTLIFLLIGFLLIPAPLVAGFIDSRLPGPVYLENLSGLWWNGTAKLRLMQYKGRSLEFPDFRWRTNPFALLSNQKQFEMWFGKTQSAPTLVSKNGRRWTAKNLEFQAPAEDFLRFQFSSTVRAKGTIEVKLEHVAVQSPFFADPKETVGRAIWRNAAMGFRGTKPTSIPTLGILLLPLGDVTMTFEGKIGQNLDFLEDRFRVSNVGGVVKINAVIDKADFKLTPSSFTMRPEAKFLGKLQFLIFLESLKP
jgi:Type II secretion system (T2SS), protein N